MEAVPYTVQLAGAGILRHICRRSIGDVDKRHHHKGFHLIAGGKGSSGSGAEGIDQTLDKHGADGADALLDGSGNTEAEDGLENIKIHPEIPKSQPEQRNADIGIDNAQYNRKPPGTAL